MPNAEQTRLFEELMAYREDVFRICLGFSRNPADAEDLSQDVYLKALRRIATLRDPGAARGWLLRIARNTCLDRRKRVRLFGLFKLGAAAGGVRTSDPPEAPREEPAGLAKLKEAVARLPRSQREVFVLREYGRLSYAEIAANLGLRMGTVMSRLNRARGRVARDVREVGHD